MRENIGLFKAKREDNGEWVRGYYVHEPKSTSEDARNTIVSERHLILQKENEGGCTIQGENTGEILIEYEIDPETICECTGLKDKNGKLIWENDIVKHCAEDRYVIVEFIDGKFTIEKYGYNLSASSNFTIIGNKFDMEVE